MTKPTNVTRLLSAANNTNATLVKAGPTTLRSIHGHNAAAAVRYLKLYNKVTAPTVGTDTPTMTIALAASLPFHLVLPEDGLYFVLGLGFGLVTGSADNDTTAVTAADILGLNLVWE